MLEDLKQFGLSDKESRVYLALLELGPSTVTEITRQAKINRTTGYDILESLIAKKLVVLSKKGGRRVYIAEDPEKFIKYLEKQSQNWQNRLEEAKKMLPELKSVYSISGAKPKVKYYEGIEGLKTVYEDSLSAKGVIRAWASIEDLKKVLPDYAEDYFKRRAKKGIYIRSIIPTSSYGVHLKSIGEKYLREVMLMPPNKFKISLEAYIYNDKVSFMSLREKFGVIIESKEIAEAQKSLHDLAWEAAKKYNRKEEKRLKEEKLKKKK